VETAPLRPPLNWPGLSANPIPSPQSAFAGRVTHLKVWYSPDPHAISGFAGAGWGRLSRKTEPDPPNGRQVLGLGEALEKGDPDRSWAVPQGPRPGPQLQPGRGAPVARFPPHPAARRPAGSQGRVLARAPGSRPPAELLTGGRPARFKPACSCHPTPAALSLIVRNRHPPIEPRPRTSPLLGPRCFRPRGACQPPSFSQVGYTVPNLVSSQARPLPQLHLPPLRPSQIPHVLVSVPSPRNPNPGPKCRPRTRKASVRAPGEIGKEPGLPLPSTRAPPRPATLAGVKAGDARSEARWARPKAPPPQSPGGGSARPVGGGVMTQRGPAAAAAEDGHPPVHGAWGSGKLFFAHPWVVQVLDTSGRPCKNSSRGR